MVQKVLEEGTTAEDNLASKLDDSRWVDFSKAFGFGGGETRTNTDPVAMAAIVADNEAQSFEVAVGEQDESMRIALYALREMQGSLFLTMSTKKAQPSRPNGSISLASLSWRK
ncbi:DUF1217 domain-containing protein [Pseudophaeobacter leonis]|uniref:DUF1217 domain-containing protein n=1 Tax=Pseudophaeobacter leonis TaxID=1144477 RepID=UPI00240920F5|nr:DUF1217 domain-containing protein [Pseudophaeobacter leonis]